MNCESMTASIWCNDHCGMLVFDRTIWAKDDELLEFSFMDSYIGRREYQGLFGRLRRAWHALVSKPLYYAGIVIVEKERARKFLEECLDILDTDAGGKQNETDRTTEEAE